MKITLPSGLRSLKIGTLVGALALAACWAFGAEAEKGQSSLAAKNSLSIGTQTLGFTSMADVMFLGGETAPIAWLIVSPIKTDGPQAKWYQPENVRVKLKREPIVTKTKDGWEITFR